MRDSYMYKLRPSIETIAVGDLSRNYDKRMRVYDSTTRSRDTCITMQRRYFVSDFVSY